MERYKGLGGDSGVIGFELGQGSITLQFKDGSVYLYTDGSAGSSVIQAMQELATEGEGLNTYINRYVRKGYASKLS